MDTMGTLLVDRRPQRRQSLLVGSYNHSLANQRKIIISQFFSDTDNAPFSMEVLAAINRKSQHNSIKPVQPKPLRYNSTIAVKAKEVCTEQGLLHLAT
jgi:hypothetical protein